MKIKKTINETKDFFIKTNFLIRNKVNFKTILTNYTAELQCEEIPFFNIKFLKKNQNKLAFIAFKKIEKDLKTWTANEPPIINKNECTYFSFDKNFKSQLINEATNLDLKSAYATILFNNCFISLETFNFISKLNKIDRLTCIGMLASRKDIFTYQDGRPIMHEEKTNPLEPYFYYCVNQTACIMDELRKKLEKDFIFTWVDSVYYRKSIANDYLLTNYLNENCLNFRIESIRYFQSQRDENKIKINFIDTKNKIKTFNLPLQTFSLKKEILQAYNLI